MGGNDMSFDNKESVATFDADMPGVSLDAKGNCVIRLMVAPEHKWEALALSEIRGRRFTVDIWAPAARASTIKATLATAKPVALTGWSRVAWAFASSDGVDA